MDTNPMFHLKILFFKLFVLTISIICVDWILY